MFTANDINEFLAFIEAIKPAAAAEALRTGLFCFTAGPAALILRAAATKGIKQEAIEWYVIDFELDKKVVWRQWAPTKAQALDLARQFILEYSPFICRIETVKEWPDNT